jgi:hypothetical protein
VTGLVSAVLLAPFPLWCFESCKIKYKIKRKILSEEEDFSAANLEKEGGS